MNKPSKTAAELRERILNAMQEDIGISQKMAEPFVEAVMRCFAGEQPYFPARKRTVSVERLHRALASGARPKDVAKEAGVSLRHLYRLVPGGKSGIVRACNDD